MTYAEICYRVRKHFKLNQKDFAVLIGSTQTEVSFIERGFIPRDPGKIQKIMLMYTAILNSGANV